MSGPTASRPWRTLRSGPLTAAAVYDPAEAAGPAGQLVGDEGTGTGGPRCSWASTPPHPCHPTPPVPPAQVMSALETFMRRVRWAPLDVLVIDMPPGTGRCMRGLGGWVGWGWGGGWGGGGRGARDQRCVQRGRSRKEGGRTVHDSRLMPAGCTLLRGEAPTTAPASAPRCSTGDAQLSISQRLRLSGALIVTTPQVCYVWDQPRHVHGRAVSLQAASSAAVDAHTRRVPRAAFPPLLVAPRSAPTPLPPVLRCRTLRCWMPAVAAPCFARWAYPFSVSRWVARGVQGQAWAYVVRPA